MEALGSFYRYLREQLNERIIELTSEAEQSHPNASEWVPTLSFQFFSLDKPEGRHIRIVTAAGVLVISYNQPHGHITAYFHFVNEEDVANSTHLFRFENRDAELALIHITREQTVIRKEEEIPDLLLKEMLIPSITQDRIRAASESDDERNAA
jgi:hypothetical protein